MATKFLFRPSRAARLRCILALVLSALLGVWWTVQVGPHLQQAKIDRATPQALQEMADARPDDVGLHLAISRALFEQDLPAAALAVVSSPLLQPSSPTERASLQGRQAEALILTGQDEAGRALFKQALAADSYCLPALAAEGLWLENRFSWHWAESVYRVILNHDPDDAFIWRHLGRCLSRQSQYDEAITALRTALQTTSHPAPVLLELGNVCCDQGQYTQGENYYRQAIQADPANIAARTALILARAADARTTAEYEAARQGLLSLMPSAPAATHTLLGKLELRFGDASRAHEDLMAAEKLGDRRPEVYFNLASADRALGLQKEADVATKRFREIGAARLRVTTLEQQAAQQPQDVPLNLQLAAAYASTGDFQEAAAVYRAVLRLQPGNEEAAVQLRSLGK